MYANTYYCLLTNQLNQMATKYTLALPNHTSFQNLLRTLISLFMLLCLCFMGYAQKGKGGKKGGPKGNIEDITLTTCVQEMENGLTKAWFGYTNPNDDTIILPEGDSYVFLSDKIDDDEYQGVEKFTVLNSFEPGTVEKAFFVVFNSNGHAKWTLVQNGNSETKIRAAADSPVCTDPCVVCPVFGGVGKSFTPIGAELTALATGVAGPQPSDIIFQFNPNDPTEVLIEIVPKGCSSCLNDVLKLLQSLAPYNDGRGFDRVYDADPLVSDFIVDPIDIIDNGYATIDVYFPISRLLELNDYPDLLNFNRSLYRPIPNVGLVDSQGDAAMYTNIVRESFVIRDEPGGTSMPVDGSGIKIGVISDSYDKANLGESQATADVGSKDLPGNVGPIGIPNGNPDYPIPVEVLKDYPYGEASDEGRAMLQIIHDVAPGAALGFSTGVLSPRDMALAIDNFLDAGYNIVTDDVTYPLEPFYDDNIDGYDGSIAKAIKRFTDSGGLYVTSAGNFANTGYKSVFVNSDETPFITPALDPGTIAHVFDVDTQDVMQEIEVDQGTYFLVLQWDEDQASQNNSMGAATDLDIYIVSETGQVLVNTNRVNDFGDAVEAVIFQSFADNARANIMITSANGDSPANLAFRYIIYRSNGLQILEYIEGTPTVTGHAMTDAAVTVGAFFHDFTENPSFEPEDFSSYGGDLLNGQSPQIDILGPDGVDVNIPDFAADTDGNGKSNFKGTSAAAPHVAGALALLKSAQPSWYPDGLPMEALQLLQTTAIPVNGDPDQKGSGFLDAVAALSQIAAQTAVVETLTIEGPSADETCINCIVVKLTGKYFPIPEDTEEPEEPTEPEVPLVKLDDGEVQTPLAVNSFSETEITVIVPPFIGNPNVVVYTDPITNGGTDGGDSKPFPILDDGRIAIRITAVDVEIEYGQAYEDKFDFAVEGLSLEEFNELEFPEVVFATSATPPYPGANNYAIIPSFDMANATAAQIATLEDFLPYFEDGELSVTKKELTISHQELPEITDNDPPLNYTYGAAISLPLYYTYSDSDIADPNDPLDFPYSAPLPTFPDFDTWISEAHETDFAPDNTLALINRFNAVVNSEVFDELQGGSWMATENTINNRFNAVVNGEVIEMGLVNLEVEDLEDYITNRFNAVVNTNRFNAVVNGQDLVNGLTSLNNRFVAVVNNGGLSADETTFNKVFAVLNVDDESEDTEGEVDLEKFYALNLITGLDVTGSDEGQVQEHYSYPGAFIAPIAANFNITFESSAFTVDKAHLLANLSSIESIFYGSTLTQEDIELELNGFVYGETAVTVFADPNCVPEELSGGEICPIVIPYYFVDEAGTEFEFGTVLDAGNYQIKIREPKNYSIGPLELGNVEVLKRELTVDADPISIEYGLPLEVEDIIKTGEGCPEGGCPVIQGFADEEAEAMFFAEFGGNPYYLVPIIDGVADEEVIISLSAPLEVGSYGIRVFAPENDNYVISPSSLFGVVTVTPASLSVTVKTSPNYETSDLIIQQGETIDTSLIITSFSGFKYGDTQEDVFPGGISYFFEDANGVEYTEGATGVYFIKIIEPQEALNYIINYTYGVLYVNPTGNHLRKIRTYLDCVEEDFIDGTLDYIAHYRYENPNDETIYIEAEGPENKLTGPAEYSGELPFIFLPGEGTFEIRFDGKTLKWELTSRDSTHKSSTTSNANSKSNKCDSGNSGNKFGDSDFMISPNPTSDFVTIVQSFEGVVTLDVFDFYGIFYRSINLDGRNGPIEHKDIIDMSAYPNGMYFFRFSTNQDVQAYIVVKE